MPMTPVLRMQGISKRFPGVTALDSVDLEVYPSEVVALIGENGAGKSTLMKVLEGIHRPDAGSIEIDGAPVEIRSVRDAGRYSIGFIHQELQLLDNLDIAANIFLGRELKRRGPLHLINRKAMEAETARQLQRIGVSLSPRTPVGRLSLAQKQLVEIMKSLTRSTRLLVMDEPTSSLTQVETKRLLQMVVDLGSRGVSVVYISHRLGEIEQIADRVVALRDGKNVGGLARDSIGHDNMVRLMVGRDLGDFYVARETPKEHICLEIRKLRTQRYPAHEVSLSVRHGEILGLAGLVGAGRTDLARALFGIERPLAGEVFVDGVSLNLDSARNAIAAGMVLVPEDRRTAGLILPMSVRENVTLPGLATFAPLGIIQSDRECAAAKKMREELTIKAPSIETPVQNLSGGNQQKVVLAKWLRMTPKVIVFDEPTRGIDVATKAELYRLMRQLAERGVAMLLISSDMEEILRASDRVAVMHDGRITGILQRSALSEEAVMRLAVA